jgi:hypothetical protein
VLAVGQQRSGARLRSGLAPASRQLEETRTHPAPNIVWVGPGRPTSGPRPRRRQR